MNNYNFREREYPLREILKNEFINKSEMIKNEIGDRIKNYTGWAALHLLGNLDIHFKVTKEFVNKNQADDEADDVFNSIIFYVEIGKIAHLTEVSIFPVYYSDSRLDEERKEFFVTTFAYTAADYRGKGLFAEARKIMENGVIEYQRNHKYFPIVFDAMLVNQRTKKFLENWFLKKGYKRVGEHAGIYGNTIELRKIIL